MIRGMQTAATALRILSPRPNILGPEDFESLQNIDTTILPDGSMCVVSGVGIYLLNKLSTATAADINIIEPASGPGRWIFVTPLSPTASVLGAQSALSTATTPVTVATSGGQSKWTVFPTSAYNGTFDSSLWAFDSSTGVLTYLGEGRPFEVTAYLSAGPSTAAKALIGLDIDVNGNLVGTTDRTQETVEVETGALTTDIVSLATSRVGGIANGATVRAVTRNGDAATDITAYSVNIVVRPF
jgi:hypothetical protein